VAAALGTGSSSYSQETPEARNVNLAYADPFPDSQAPTTNKTAPPNAAPAADGSWHIVLAPYLWLPGVHGTLGVRDHQASIHASAGDLLSHFRFGLMAVVEARHDRWVTPVDFVWVRLGEDKALPFPNEAITADVKASEFIMTPKFGYRLIDLDKLKFDGLIGIRYWHLGQNLQFSPSELGLDFSGSQNWVDQLVGARIQAPLSPKVEVTIAGDVGGGGVTSQLDYQVAGLLGYRFKPRWTVQAGYRYLYLDRRSGGSILTFAMSGAMFGVTIKLK
jgi:hypothetical protein